MASIKTLGNLFRALGSQDIKAAIDLARAITAEEERKGHRSAAAQLRGALMRNGTMSSVGSVSNGVFDVTAALIPERPGPSLSEVVMTPGLRRETSEIVAEWTNRFALQKLGVPRRRKLVFSGPPGCGKTLTARGLGSAMGRPVLTVRFSNLVGSYLGQTGANLRSMFAYAESNLCVLLLDEFDAISRTRGRVGDVGELDRIVISLLQELDHTAPQGLVIAATNTPQAIDPAIWRRFDAHLNFPQPSRKVLLRYLEERWPGRRNSQTQAVPLRIRSFADAERWMLDLLRQDALRSLSHRNGKEG